MLFLNTVHAARLRTAVGECCRVGESTGGWRLRQKLLVIVVLSHASLHPARASSGRDSSLLLVPSWIALSESKRMKLFDRRHYMLVSTSNGHVLAFARSNPMRTVLFLGWVGLNARRRRSAVAYALCIFRVYGRHGVGN